MKHPNIVSIKPKHIFIIILMIIFTRDTFSQNFVKVTDSANAIVTSQFSGNYFGTSWVDVDNDGYLDLYINRKGIYRNNGNGNFSMYGTILESNVNNLGNSWADYNNDGFIDCWVTSTGAAASFLFKNNGDGSFTKITTGEIGDSSYNTGWGNAWADYDNDGYPDLLIAAANAFGTVNHSNRLYHNNGDGSFSRVNMPGLTDTLAPFTIPTWSDYDQDGDMDLFIGTGPGGSVARDNLYKNMLKETGTATLVRLDLPPLSTDLQDGQVWNLIDYDNDGDLDACLTNYASSATNRLYRNNNGTYERMTEAQVGTIVSDLGLFLANNWGDFDNDGDIDCFITREGAKPYYYNNNGNGTFTRLDSLAFSLINGGNYGATAGDYDKNGTLDLYVTGSTLSNGLYKNELTNGYSWVNIRCIGGGPQNNLSNKSAIGTKVKAKATINGTSVWQYREVLAQNSFNSMNMLNVHMGFGNATVIDSLVIIWPKGLQEVYTNVQPNDFYNATEGQGIVSGINSFGSTVSPDKFKLYQNYPNPFNPKTLIGYELTKSSKISLKIFDILGKEIRTLVSEFQPAGNYKVSFDGEGLPSGTYIYRLSAGEFSLTKKMTLLK
ncbi:MAG TPA: FG-GAP-like repeat-containing protein [Ignavibacteria bacterium]|nr:FG-GAP-like repeat-containing protein [Ignavibacteria bacterium]